MDLEISTFTIFSEPWSKNFWRHWFRYFVEIMGSIIGRTAAGVDRPRVKGCLKTKAEKGATRKVLTRKVLILKIGLRVVLTDRRRHRDHCSGQRGKARLSEVRIGLKLRGLSDIRTLLWRTENSWQEMKSQIWFDPLRRFVKVGPPPKRQVSTTVSGLTVDANKLVLVLVGWTRTSIGDGKLWHCWLSSSIVRYVWEIASCLAQDFFIFCVLLANFAVDLNLVTA